MLRHTLQRLLLALPVMFGVLLLGFLLIQQRLLLALFLFQLCFLRGDLFTGLLQLPDGLLPRLVQIAEVSLQALPTLALFATQNQLDAGMLALTKGGIKLRGEVSFLCGFLLLKLRNGRIHCVYLFVELGEGVLGFTQRPGGG